MPDNRYHDPESVVKEIKRKNRRKFSAEEKIGSGAVMNVGRYQ